MSEGQVGFPAAAKWLHRDRSYLFMSPKCIHVTGLLVIGCNGKFIHQDKGLMPDCEHPMFSLKLLSYSASPKAGWNMIIHHLMSSQSLQKGLSLLLSVKM